MVATVQREGGGAGVVAPDLAAAGGRGLSHCPVRPASGRRSRTPCSRPVRHARYRDDAGGDRGSIGSEDLQALTHVRPCKNTISKDFQPKHNIFLSSCQEHHEHL